MNLKLYFVTLAAFLALDGLWLAVIARHFYAQKLGYLMAKSPQLLAAGIFYLLFVFGLIFFVISPALRQSSLLQAIVTGALFGLITYATYDLTNLATIRDWPLVVTLVDLAWGSFLSAATAGISYLIYQWLS